MQRVSDIVIRTYDHGRAEGPREIAAKVFKLCAELGKVHGKLVGWSARSPDGALTPIETADDCEQAVRARAKSWRFGEREQVAYGPVFEAKAMAARLSLVCGVPPQEAWTPNQTQLALGMASGIAVREVDVLAGLLSALAKGLSAEWGHVGVDGVPTPPMPPFADGSPVVGWITYVSSAYPAAPATLPEPSVARTAPGGTLLMASPARVDAEAIERLRAALKEAGVLLPAYALRKKS